MRTAVILAAGFGSRLAEAGDGDGIKPLTPVAGRPLMLRTLESLAAAGCERVVVVLGFRGAEIQAEIEAAYDGPLAVTFVVNPRYELSNGVSVLAARPKVDGPFLLTMADHVFGDEVMALAGDARPPEGGATLLVDRKLDQIFDMDDATKVRTDQSGERIVAIGKQLEDFDAVDTGLFLCTPALFDALARVLEAQGDCSLSDGVSALSAAGTMTVLDVGDGFWQDVDTPSMLAHAEARLRARGG